MAILKEPFGVRLNHVDGDPARQVRHFAAACGASLCLWVGIATIAYMLWKVL